MSGLRRLTVCADDYALGPSVDQGVLALAAQGRINALSCLVTSPRWPDSGAALQGCPAATGLHFNLTEGEPLSEALRRHWPRFPTLGRLIAQAMLGRLPAAVADEFQAQLLRFVTVRDQAPAFIDGHQHVHALPGVRPLALAASRQLGVPLRNTGRVCGPGFAFKRRVIAACGGRALAAQAVEQGLPMPTALVGVYDFDPEADYRRLVRGWLRGAPDGAMLFCHPALGHPDQGDVIAAARAREMAYLASDAFADDLRAAGITLA